MRLWPRPRDKRTRDAEMTPRWARPLSFHVEAPAEITGQGTVDGPTAPRVSRQAAMSVPAVKHVRDLIAGTLGTLPLREYNPGRETVTNSLFGQPEVDVARTVTMTMTVEDMLFEGRSWWRITQLGWHGFPVEVRRLEPRSVFVNENHQVFISPDTGLTQGYAWDIQKDAWLIRIDSPNDPLLVAGARVIRAALELDRAAATYAREPLPLGYFSPKADVDPVDKDTMEQILDDWADSNRRRAWGYVGAALEAKVLQMSPEQLQLAAARDYAVLEISRLGGVDPEELGVSTTSRTYANAEQRRLDLLDFTLAAYVNAIESRLSMRDVLPRGHYAKFQYNGFLRSDTLTRLQVYDLGRKVGVYDSNRIAELEDIPSAEPATPPAPPAPPAASPSREDEPMPQATQQVPSLAFTVPSGPLTIGFTLSDADAEFRVSTDKRTVSGLAVPWNVVARSAGAKWKFAPDSLHWADEGRIKLNRDHDRAASVGRATTLDSKRAGLAAAFKIARGPEGDRVLELAEDGVFDGFSVEVDFEDGDGWQVDPTDESVRLVERATLRAVAITAMPAYDNARVTSVAATREGTTMTAPTTAPPPGGAAPSTPDTVTYTTLPDFTAFTAGLSEALAQGVADAFARLPLPQGAPEGRQVVPAGRVQVTREAPVYSMNGQGASLIRDAWRSRTENDGDARDRLIRFQQQTQDAAEQALQSVYFGASTGTHGAVIPPGYRPELYVTQLMQGRPLVESVSRGTLSDATPFTLPRFQSMSGMTGDHTEGGATPLDGTLSINTATVTPGAISGLFRLTREIVDSSNPAIDAIAMQAMQESYSQQTEAKVYNQLNGAEGQGGVIAPPGDGFVPSGAQVRTTTGPAGSNALLQGIRAALAVYPFRRFAAPTRAHLSQEATTVLATAVGSDNRPLLPSIGAQNTAGLGNAITQGWFIDGLAFVPTWSMTGNAVGDADVMMFNNNDVWAWESPLLTFRFEERGGPTFIDLALFGYFATRIIRPIGLSAIRHAVA